MRPSVGTPCLSVTKAHAAPTPSLNQTSQRWSPTLKCPFLPEISTGTFSLANGASDLEGRSGPGLRHRQVELTELALKFAEIEPVNDST